MRSRPDFSVIRRSPSGSGSTAQGLSKPVATTVTSKATSDFTPQARVCPAKAGFCSRAFGGRVSSGAHGSVGSVASGEAAVETGGGVTTEGWPASGVFRAQAAPLSIGSRVRAKAVWFFFTDCPLKDLPTKLSFQLSCRVAISIMIHWHFIVRGHFGKRPLRATVRT